MFYSRCYCNAAKNVVMQPSLFFPLTVFFPLSLDGGVFCLVLLMDVTYLPGTNEGLILSCIMGRSTLIYYASFIIIV